MVSIAKDDGDSFCMDVNDASTRASWDYHYNKSKRISGLGSHDPKYYDEIITKVNIQASLGLSVER
jgi:hypothetical protein